MTDYKREQALSVFCDHIVIMKRERKAAVDWYKNCARWYRQEGERIVNAAYWLSDEEYSLAEEQKRLLRSMGLYAWDTAVRIEESIARVLAARRVLVVVRYNKELR